MRNQRSFSLEFKRQVEGELLSSQSRPAQLCRRYNISSSVLYHWKKQYSRGNPVSSTGEPTEKGAAAQPQPVPGKRPVIRAWGCLGVAIRRGYEMMKLSRSSFYYSPRFRSPDQMKVEADSQDRIETICLGFPRYPNRVKGMDIRRLNQVWHVPVTPMRMP